MIIDHNLLHEYYDYYYDYTLCRARTWQRVLRKIVFFIVKHYIPPKGRIQELILGGALLFF